MKDGIIKGKQAYNYNNQVNAKTRTNRFNSFLNREIPKNKKQVIADLLCGSGITLELLKDRAKKVYAVDASKEMIDICKEQFKNQNIEFIISDVKNTPIKSKSCDVVLIRMGLHHVKDKKKVIDEVYRILKKNGKFIVVDKFLAINKFITYVWDVCRNIKMGMPLFIHHFIDICEFEKIINKKFKIKSIYSHRIKHTLKANIVLEKL